MKRGFTAALAACLLLLGASGAAQDVVETRHGYVVDREVVEGNSNVPIGAVLGGLVGLATASGKSGSTKAKRTVGGAILGGVVAGQIDRSKRYWVYTVRFPGGAEQRIAIQDDRLKLGDCARVTYYRDDTEVDYASDYFCRPEASRKAVEQPAPDPIDDEDPCRAARQRLLDEEDPEKIEILIEKVKVICEKG